MTVLAAWYLVIYFTQQQAAVALPYKSEQACEIASKKVNDDAPYGRAYCIPGNN